MEDNMGGLGPPASHSALRSPVPMGGEGDQNCSLLSPHKFFLVLAAGERSRRIKVECAGEIH